MVSASTRAVVPALPSLFATDLRDKTLATDCMVHATAYLLTTLQHRYYSAIFVTQYETGDTIVCAAQRLPRGTEAAQRRLTD